MTTLVPMPMKLKASRKKTMTWLATPRAATAPSETWLTMNVSTVPISTRSVCSTKIGQAVPMRLSLAGGDFVMWRAASIRERRGGESTGLRGAPGVGRGHLCSGRKPSTFAKCQRVPGAFRQRAPTHPSP